MTEMEFLKRELDLMHKKLDSIPDTIRESVNDMKDNLREELTGKIDLAITRHIASEHRKSSETGSFKINLTNAKPVIKWLVYILIASGIFGGGYSANKLGNNNGGQKYERSINE